VRPRLLLTLPLVAAAIALAIVFGGAPALTLLPFLVLLVPLLAGRYLGEERIARRAVRRAAAPRRAPRIRWGRRSTLGAPRRAFTPAAPPRGPPLAALA
jgi:hypothetical protein